MKNKKNIKLVTFTCDECGKETEERNEIDCSEFKGVHPFPYEKGWIYIYNLVMRFSTKRLKLEDKHFCSMKCLDKSIKNSINKIKKEKK